MHARLNNGTWPIGRNFIQAACPIGPNFVQAGRSWVEVDGAEELVRCYLMPVEDPAVGLAEVVGGQQQILLAVGTNGDAEAVTG